MVRRGRGPRNAPSDDPIDFFVDVKDRGSPPEQSGVSIARAAIAIAAISVAVKLVGFGEKQVIAYYFGADARVDAYFVALGFALAVFVSVRELIEPTFLPLFVAHLDAGRRARAWRLFGSVALGVGVLVVPILGVAWVGADALASRLAPDFDPETTARTARLIRVMLPGAGLLALSSLSYLALNGTRRFALPASGDLIQRGMTLLCVVAFATQLGVVSLAIGVLVGALGRLLLHTLGLAREFRWLSWPWTAMRDSREDARVLLLLMAPIALGVAFSQVSELADNFFSSSAGAGAVAARSFARRIVEVPILLVPYALSIVVFPYFSSLAERKDWDRLFDSLGKTLRGLALAFAYLSVMTAMLAGPVTTVLLERGAFDATAREATASALALYALGLVPFALEALLVPFYYALRDTRTPVIIGIVGVVINIGATGALVGPFGIAGVAGALVLSKSFKVVALGLLLRSKRAGLPIGVAVFAGLRLLLAAIVCGLGVWVFMDLWTLPLPTDRLVSQLAYLVAASGVGAVGFLCVALLGAPDRRLLVEAGVVLWRAVRHTGSRNG